MTGAVARHPKPDVKAKDFRSHHLRPDEMSWQKTRFPGCEVKPLLVDAKSGMATLLFKMAPGAELPDHEHVLIEQTYVLEGSLVDKEGPDAGIEVGPGEFVWRPAGSRHSAWASARSRGSPYSTCRVRQWRQSRCRNAVPPRAPRRAGV